MRGVRDNPGNVVGWKKLSNAKPWDCKNDFLKMSICCLIRLFIMYGIIEFWIDIGCWVMSFTLSDYGQILTLFFAQLIVIWRLITLAVAVLGSATRNFVSKYLMFLSYPAQQDLYGWIVGHFNRHYLAAIIQFKFDFLSFRFDFHLVAGERPIGFHQSLRFLDLGFGIRFLDGFDNRFG